MNIYNAKVLITGGTQGDPLNPSEEYSLQEMNAWVNDIGRRLSIALQARESELKAGYSPVE